MASGVFSIPLDAFSLSSTEASSGNSPALVLREYIGSSENQLVQVAVQAVLDGHSLYNPLVLCGPTGTGKTLLARGLAAQWRNRWPADRVIVTCGADFARAYANAVDTDRISELRRKFRGADLLVVDDVHQLRRKRAAQQELARSLDALLDTGAAALITGCQSPSEDTALAAALRSRLAAGLVVPLATPGWPARRLLLRRLADLHEIQLSEGALELLAEGLRDSCVTVPDLNHAISQLGHEARVEGQAIDLDRIRNYLEQQTIRHRPTLRSITDKASKHFLIPIHQLRGPTRRRNVVRARGVAMYLAWNLTGKSLEAIGHYFGKRDHTTVLHACRKTEDLRQSDPAIAEAIVQLSAQLDRY